MLRLPTAEGTPGKLVWTVMGTDTVTNLQVIMYSATVIAVLLGEGVLRAWVSPDELAFIEPSITIAIVTRELDVTASVLPDQSPEGSGSPARSDTGPVRGNNIETGLAQRRKAAVMVAQQLEAVGEIQVLGHAFERPRDEGGGPPMKYADLSTQGAPAVPSAGPLVDVPAGTDRAEDALALAADEAHAPSPIDRVGTIELAAEHHLRLLDPSRDVASLVFGRTAAPLVIRLRWALVIVGILGTTTPVLVTFAVHWASGGAGQFALAYPWPLWLEVWQCVGWGLVIGVNLMWYASLQRELAWMALKQTSTLWTIAMTGLWTAGFISLHDFGIHRPTWANVPVYMVFMLFFPLVATVASRRW
jgi:hypothetical protein